MNNFIMMSGVFNVFLSCQADVASADGATPLFNSCRSGSAACVGLLLQHGASVHSTHQLASPMHEAAVKGARMKEKTPPLVPSFGSDPTLCSHQITESVWSCCRPVELRLTLSCQRWDPHFTVPVEQELLAVWRCCCWQVNAELTFFLIENRFFRSN